MDFSAWSPSHTILVIVMVAVTVVGFIGQVAVLFHRTRQLEKQQDKQGEDLHRQGETFIHALERLENRIDKQGEDLHRQGETFIHALERLENRIDKRFEEVNQRLSSMDASIRQLNQNHIDHLSHHQS